MVWHPRRGSTANRTAPDGLWWQEVVHVDYQTGSKGGEYWWLTLACGHHKAVPIPRFRAEQVVTSKRQRREAPLRCRCTLCAPRAADIVN